MKLRFVVLCVLLSTAILVGQTFRGTILGSVSDPSGACFAGATVKVRMLPPDLSARRHQRGRQLFDSRIAHRYLYSVPLSQTGFQTSVTSNVEVNVATERRVDAQLKTGQVTQRSKSPAANSPQIETTTNELGGTLTSQSSRIFRSMAATTPS